MKKHYCIIVLLTLIFCYMIGSGVVLADEEDPIDPTPEITEEITPTEEPVDIETPTPIPTDTPTPVPTNTNKPTSTPVPTKIPDFVLSLTGKPTEKPKATSTPAPIVKATNTPTPTATQTPTPTITPKPYVTVIPPSELEEYPKPNGRSDKEYISKSPSVIKVDGILEELWDNTEYTDIKNVGWGSNGASGQFKTFWNKETFFVLVKVVDTTPDTKDDFFSRQDCVELFFNPNGEKPESYAIDDLHIKINRDGLIEYGANADETNTKAMVIPTEDGYIVEAELSFTALPPVYGSAIGFDVRVNDSFGDQYRDYMLQWSDTSMTTFSDLSRIGSVYLK